MVRVRIRDRETVRVMVGVRDNRDREMFRESVSVMVS